MLSDFRCLERLKPPRLRPVALHLPCPAARVFGCPSVCSTACKLAIASPAWPHFQEHPPSSLQINARVFLMLVCAVFKCLTSHLSHKRNNSAVTCQSLRPPGQSHTSSLPCPCCLPSKPQPCINGRGISSADQASGKALLRIRLC